jgi:hypothetical protein
MRKPFILSLLILLLSSCSFGPPDADNRGSEMADSTLKAINSSLELVNQKQGIVSVSSRAKESMHSIADNRRIQSRITGNIVLIDSVMNDSRERLSSLEKTLGSHRRKIAELEEEITGMARTIETKQREVDSLKTALARSSSLASALHDSLRAGYVIAAPQDSLAKWKIIEKEGGFLGIFGSSWRMSGHIPLKKFSRINRLKSYRIAIPARAGKFSVMTLHNRNSYSIVKDNGKHSDANRHGSDSSVIVIKSPEEFWAASHILVIKLPR